MTPEEQTQFDADQAVAATQQNQRNANAQTTRQSLTAHLADALDANTATTAQQRQALSLCLRGTVRLSRLVLDLYVEGNTGDGSASDGDYIRTSVVRRSSVAFLRVPGVVHDPPKPKPRPRKKPARKPASKPGARAGGGRTRTV